MAARIESFWLRDGPLQWLLRPLSWLFGAVVAARRFAFLHGLLRIERVGVPVVVVGNRIVGGAGKTPTTIALARHLAARGWHPGIVSRGYGRRGDDVAEVQPASEAEDVGDEPLLMRMRAAVPVWVGRDRVAAARALVAAHPQVDVLLCDDGLQHLRLGRDVEVIVFDERGAGNGALLPAGPLREPVDAPSTAATQLVLYNAAAPTTLLAGYLARRSLAGLVRLDAWRDGAPPSDAALQSLRGRKVVACAGLAHPARFFDSLRQAGLEVRELPLPDHHDYASLAWSEETADVIVTEKDAVKLDPQRVARERPQSTVWVAPLDFAPDPQCLARIESLLRASR